MNDVALPAPKPTIDTCNACGKLFPRTAARLCSQCIVVEENRFLLVRDYLLDNDGAPFAEIARATGVSMADVRRFSEGGRLVEVSAGVDSCTCGGVGQRCRSCRMQLAGSFRRVEHEMRRSTPVDDGSSDGSGRTSYVRRIRRIGE